MSINTINNTFQKNTNGFTLFKYIKLLLAWFYTKSKVIICLKTQMISSPHVSLHDNIFMGTQQNTIETQHCN